MEIDYTSPDLPVLYDCDAVVYGGSFGGTAAALTLARAGRHVVLVEPRTYLGREMTATLRPWLAAASPSAPGEFLRPLIDAAAPAASGAYAFNLDAVKLFLEDTLLGAGVTLLYASLLVGLDIRGGALRGIVVGNKSGRQVIRAPLLVDTSETALAARLSGEMFGPEPETALYRRTLEFDGVAAGFELTDGLSLGGVRGTFHAGTRDARHFLVECELALPAASGDAFAITARETRARHLTMAFAARLIYEHAAFESAYLAGASYELDGPHSAPLAGRTPARTGFDAYAGTVRGVWHANQAAAPDRPFSEAAFTSGHGASFAAWLCARPEPADAPEDIPPPSPRRTGTIEVREPRSPQRGRPYVRTAAPPVALPVLREAGVLVVGGGSSGATAAIVAAREGVRTVLLEMNPGLGGTGTFGGVHSYWFGRRTGFSAEVMRLTADMHAELSHPVPKGLIPKWNIEAKSYALLKAADAAGADILTNCFVIGALVDGAALRGVVVATRTGPALVLANVTIDATGDGDVAAFGGADYIYGDQRDHVVMWYALAQFARPGLTRNHFTSMVDVSNIEDYTRAILAGRRRGGRGEMHDHGIYVAPRESRHIKGRVVLTLNDQLRQRRWADVVNVAFSNHDVKGHTGSDWLRAGLIPPNLAIEIPYAALLPERLENLIVVGKAISATHDALPAIRMQADLENLGGVAALAAAQAVRDGCRPADIDLPRLQSRLIVESILPPDVLTRALADVHYSDDQLRAMIDAMPADQPLIAYSDMELTDLYDGLIPLVEVCCAGPRAVPLLEAALARADGPRKVLLAQALALTGSTAGVPALIEAIEPYLSGDRLPPRVAHIRYTQLPPDHGAMPEAAYLLYCLGMAPDERALPVWRRVAALLAAAREADFYEEMPGLFYYADAVCFGAERLGSTAMIPVLERMHGCPFLHGKASYGGFQPDFIQERLAYLELVVGRALARCGSADGCAVLVSYLNDNRALLAEHAHTELVSITGQDFGKDAPAWADWLEANADHIGPRPWRAPTEPQQAWDVAIQRAAR